MNVGNTCFSAGSSNYIDLAISPAGEPASRVAKGTAGLAVEVGLVTLLCPANRPVPTTSALVKGAIRLADEAVSCVPEGEAGLAVEVGLFTLLSGIEHSIAAAAERALALV